MASGSEKRWIGSGGVFNPQSGGGAPSMPEWKKELIQRRKNLAKCMASTSASGHSHSQQCHGTTATNSTQIHRQTATSGARIGGQQQRSSGSTVGECRATVQSSCERDGVRVSQAVASNGSSSSKCCHEDKLCEVHESSGRNSSSGGEFSDLRDIQFSCDNHRQLDAKMVAVCGEKLEYDTSEELKYGAGIVSKLVSRFMSYTMRVSAAKERPSLDNLRRATSLNNLLDDDNEEEAHPRKVNDENSVHRESADAKVSAGESAVDTTNSGNNCDKGIYRQRQPQMGTYQHSEIMRRRQMGRGNDSLKRARSVDALLRVDNIRGDGVKTEQDMMTPDSIAEETTPSNGVAVPTICDVTIEDKIINARERGEAKPKRLKSFMEDPERPPPDLVKTTLRIFEATANRRGRPPTCRSGEVAAKVASFKSILSHQQEKPAILYPKPPVSPKKALVGKNVKSSSHRDATMVTAKPATVVQDPVNNTSTQQSKSVTKTPTTTTTCTQATNINVIQRSPSPLAIRMDMTYRSVKNFSPTSPQSPKPDLINVSPPRRQQPQLENSHQQQENGVSMGSDSPTIAQLTNKIQSLKIESPVSGHQVASQASSQVRKVPLRSGVVSSTTEESDTSDSTDSFDDDLGDPDDDRNFGGVKRISKVELENISRAGATTEFNFGGCTSTPIRDKSHLPSLTNGGNLSIQLVDSYDDDEYDEDHPRGGVDFGECDGDVNGVKMVEKSTENGVNEGSSSIDKITVEKKEIIVDTTQCSDKQLTNQEIEKNMINREKSETNVVTTAQVVTTAPKWTASTASKKKPWKEEPQNTTMVFNFSNRKDVPDYIENDGVVLRRRREMPKPGESGFVLLGDAPLETSTDPDDSWTMGPPSPCDVDFENDNVIINGKSSLRSRGDSKQWKIRFDDSLTSTYEYPSESSQREEMLNVTSNGKTASIDDKSFNSPAYQKFLPLGLAPLANYTPVKGGALNTDFELGVKRNSPVVVESPGSATSGGNDQQQHQNQQQQQINGDLESLQYLKPATDEQTVAWSEGTRVTDLLF